MNEDILNKFINSLEINEEHLPKTGLKLNTINNKIFYVYKDRNNLFFARPEARPKNEKGFEKKNMVTRFLNNIPTEDDNRNSYGKVIFRYIKENFMNEDLVIQRAEPINYIKNTILFGAPGVGKTHNTNKLISLIDSKKKTDKEIFKNIENNTEETIILNNDMKSRVKFLTFHQSYSYEDFIEGFRPNKNGNIELEDGIFKKLCDDASKSDKNFYIVIDEINRGNISKIFGELITLIEEDKRDKYEVTLPYSKKPFKVPSNLYIIATMNSTDKSIATMDIALRRRFTFLKMKPNLVLVTNPDAKALMKSLNEFIKDNLSEDYMLGHSYFMDKKIDLEFVKEYKIRPLLEEYFFADDDKFDEVIKLMNGKND